MHPTVGTRVGRGVTRRPDPRGAVGRQGRLMERKAWLGGLRDLQEGRKAGLVPRPCPAPRPSPRIDQPSVPGSGTEELATPRSLEARREAFRGRPCSCTLTVWLASQG